MDGFRAEKPAIIIGAGGSVGRRIRRAWRATGHSHMTVGRGVDADLRWDLTGPPPPFDAARGAGIVVLAGVTPASGGDLADNLRLARAGIEAARAWGAAHVFVASSSAVYGPTPPIPVDEDAPLNASSPYAAAKIEVECETVAKDVTALRIANVAGASQPFLAIRAGGHAKLDRFADADAPMRSFIGPVSLASCFARLCDLAASGRDFPPVLNIASARPIRMIDIFAAAGVTPDRPAASKDAIAHANLATKRLAELWDVPDHDAEALWDEVRATDEGAYP
ncbi:NAD-dependent epimerase/dehydratase family protein [Palleronia sp. LCG004]|uniref:NAD-dependent epimerase/dehydratase family protein n=1 Tax=Palleronia sp. LCG004 TaxID=3079304 RepID=UPI0029432F05|nr:NAD-dependent epimerase/dehydratase family protein [Palleronia sp. LCG004]WOI57368.1 NAD-dependent epimerase/dehydratase family protein [Palleronia sp. LCG004]